MHAPKRFSHNLPLQDASHEVCMFFVWVFSRRKGDIGGKYTVGAGRRGLGGWGCRGVALGGFIGTLLCSS